MPWAIASIGEAGHEIGNHSFNHDPWLHLYSKEELIEELEKTEEAIEETEQDVEKLTPEIAALRAEQADMKALLEQLVQSRNSGA